MKKFLIMLISSLFIFGAVFADGPFTITIDGVADAFFMRRFSGDYSTKEPIITGSPYKYQGEGDMSAFQSSAFDDSINARVKFAYSGENIGGLLQIRAAPDTAILDMWDWEAWLRLFNGHFKALTGNQAQRGQVERYQHFDDFLKTKIDSFGIMFPTWKVNTSIVGGNNVDTAAEFPYGYDQPLANKGFAFFAGTETSDLFTPAGSTSRRPMGILLEGSCLPVTVSASVGGLFENLSRPFMDPWGRGNGTRLNDYDNVYAPVIKDSISFGFRAEGVEIGDMLTLAAVYKYASAHLSKTTAAQTDDIIEEKTSSHAYGLYVNIKPVMGLGVSAGYSGLAQSWTNPRYQDTNIDESKIGNETHNLSAYNEARLPLYHGADLRVCYTGFSGLTITFNNNFSFANNYGTVNMDHLYIKGWAYETQLNEDSAPGVEKRNETYIGVYNALGARYEIARTLAVDIQAANQLGFFTLKWENAPLSSVSNCFGLYAGVACMVVEKDRVRASIRGGVDLRMNSYIYQDSTSTASPVHRAGFIDFGIPVGLKVEF
ncbi:MAG: hypothetical protein LBD48_11820 [Treponema sp.]|jgi:hypothetical protein|nr:hypothetical protein [Treponema sp.]